MPSRITALAVLICVVALAGAASAAGADRMWVGFHDDPSFRWEGDRDVTLDRAKGANATMVRAVVTWASVAPTRPTDASDPFDPAYQLHDLDELVRDTQRRGMEVLLTIWGTPKWANGDRGPNVLPMRMADLTDFAQALASRYSGRYPGYPFVRFWTVWNESNLQLFLTPQFDARGRIIGPRLYARLYAAAYKGIKAGNPRALVGAGETSSHGRDRKVPGRSDTIRPGTFARLLAQANPNLKFDAYTHHPYPVPPNQKPTQRVLWPNVSLASLPRFGQALDEWFKRKNVPIWITEYGYETRPGEPSGVTVRQQASYLRHVMTTLQRDPRVDMFVWFIWQDSTSSLWQSGMLSVGGSTKPALAVYSQTARPLDARNPMLRVRVGAGRAKVKVVVREFCTNNPSGAAIGTEVRIRQGARSVSSAQPRLLLAVDCSVTVPLTFPAIRRGARYVATLDFNDVNGAEVRRTVTLLGG